MMKVDIMNAYNIRRFILKFLTCIVLAYLSCACVTSKSTQTNEDSLDNIINKYEKEAGYDLEPIYNSSKSYILLKPLRKKGVEDTKEKVNCFYVIRMNDNALILEEKILNGTMKWVNESEISIFYPSGVPDQEKAVIYNVHSKSKKLKNY
jgi:hypothetical protein